ncbi:MAG: 30S ribosomal protein S9 [Crocinitomicaceae bacterium]|nr:30S ribosomal protein S9 [Crocinitomicaceae bacterium]|tara:strand:- start:4594 stop:4980 length:387 start_codon:yes stop_codon:yes gene_type:complete
MDVINTLGRRKTSVARIYLKQGNGTITVNGKDAKEYFPTEVLQARLNRPFVVTETAGQYDVKANVKGGGLTGQVDAVLLAVSRALCEISEEHRPALKAEKLLTRDPRMVERKKFGQKKARKKFQFSKR